MSVLRITGCYFQTQYGRTGTSHSGTPGVRLSITGSDGIARAVFVDYRQCGVIAKAINGLGTKGDELQFEVLDEIADATKQPATGDQVDTNTGRKTPR